jgi:aryl-alcohol dehydrogenase-like predicted oxidoreductase
MSEKHISRRKFVRDSALAAAGLAAGLSAAGAAQVDKAKILNYNENMEYRRLGRTGLMISAVCLGGHWKRVDKMVPGVFGGKSWLDADLKNEDFKKNRREVVTRCMEVGINYIDACTWQEVTAYSEAIRDRRDKMYLGFSWYQEEMRNAKKRTKDALLATLDKGMKAAKLDYVDLWRITMHEQSSKHTNEEVEQMMLALEEAKKQGKARFTGFSSHDRPHIKWMIETYPKIVDVIVTPYTAKTKELPKDSLFEAIKKSDVGMFGIKPFAGASLFKGDSAPDSPQAEEDGRLARMAIRYILCNPAITAPIPGLINTHQVDNVAKAIQERRELDLVEAQELKEAMDEAWARLPEDHQWLKDWEYV